MKQNTASIGSQYPFINKCGNEESYDIKEIINSTGEYTLNLQSIISILSNGYIFGNDTLVTELKRKSWMDGNEFNYPLQNSRSLNSTDVAEKLEALLIEEIRDYIKPYKNIGILLSGGLDSRILAGLLKKIEITSGENFNKKIIVYNWGLEDSRDVIYSKKISNLYQWKYKHYELTPERLKENFYNNLSLGCEISPVHLHAMKEVSIDKESEIILAGTYGDSIGRGRFSGKGLKSIDLSTHSINNKTGLIKTDYFNQQISSIREKRLEFVSKKMNKDQISEVDQYANYLRRMLSVPLSIIQRAKPVKQIFTGSTVYNFMLSLPREKRNDDFYKIILKSLPLGIGEIPYAKDGKNFLDINSSESDNYLNNSHKYGKWLRNDLYEFIEENYDIGLLNDLGIFNRKALHFMFDVWKRGNTDSINMVDTQVSFLTNLCIFIKEFNLAYPKMTLKEDKFLLSNKIKSNLYIAARNLSKRN